MIDADLRDFYQKIQTKLKRQPNFNVFRALFLSTPDKQQQFKRLLEQTYPLLIVHDRPGGIEQIADGFSTHK